MNKNTLIVGLTPPLEGGSERHIYEISSRIKDSRVLTQRGSLCKNSISVPIVKKSNFVKNVSFSFFSSIYLIYLLIFPIKRYQIIHLHENLLYFIVPLLRMRFEVVVTVHGMKGFKFYDNKVLRKVFFFGLYFANKIIAVNREDEMKLEGYFGKKVYYVPNGVDLSYYKGIDSKVEMKIGFIGRLHEQKGIVYLLEAFEMISSRNPGLKLEIIGEINDYGEKLKREFKNKNIKWRGYLNDRREIAKTLKSCYVIVLPSLWEGLPLTLFESFASRRPLIISDIPAFKSVVKDEAIFFRSKDSGDLSRKLEKLLKDKKQASLIGSKGYRLAQEYTWDNITKNLGEIYEKN